MAYGIKVLKSGTHPFSLALTDTTEGKVYPVTSAEANAGRMGYRFIDDVGDEAEVDVASHLAHGTIEVVEI